MFELFQCFSCVLIDLVILWNLMTSFNHLAGRSHVISNLFQMFWIVQISTSQSSLRTCDRECSKANSSIFRVFPDNAMRAFCACFECSFAPLHKHVFAFWSVFVFEMNVCSRPNLLKYFLPFHAFPIVSMKRRNVLKRDRSHSSSLHRPLECSEIGCDFTTIVTSSILFSAQSRGIGLTVRAYIG